MRFSALRFASFLLWLGFLFVLAFLEMQAQPILFEAHLSRTPIEAQIRVWQNAEEKIEVAQVRQMYLEKPELFVPYQWEKLPLGASQNWLHFTIQNRDKKPQKCVIQTTKFDFLTFYVLQKDGTWKSIETGTSYPQSQKENVFGAYSIALLELDAEAQTEVFVKATYLERTELDLSPIQMNFHIQSESYYQTQKDTRNLAMSFYTGALLVMLLYNFFLYLITRDVHYRLYLLIAPSIYAFIFFSSGLGVDLIENAANTALYLMITSFFHINFHVLFSFYILRIKTFFPKVVKVIMVVLAVYNVLLFIAPLSNGLVGVLARALATPLVFGLFGYTLYLAFRVWKKEDYAPAYYFFWANFFYMVFMVIAVLQLLGVLPFQFLGLESWQNNLIGSVIELTLFSLSISAKITHMQKELAKQQIEQARILKEEETKRLALIEKQNRELEQKVAERTAELVERNEEIQQQNEELQITSEKLEHQHHLLEEVYKDIQASISYAQRIQEAHLPKTDLLQRCFSDYFIFFQPRDVVSGDFYWAAEIWVQGMKRQVFVVADCTGHGVPGAFMSLICANLLNQIIIERNYHDPAQILTKLDQTLRLFLNKDITQNHDGMDCALIVLDKNKKELHFSGAKRPLFYFQKQELHILRGDSKSIGGHEREKGFFHTHTLSFEEPTRFYLFSDGYADQIGGEQNRKFMIKNFRDLLTQIHLDDFKTQKQKVESTFWKWQGKESQVDDILVVGFEV
ncbi:7TM diverse intracellular signaling domain-containing protein [Hugenholtzia roseola]|uniref:7TM diverse intracellular signaling domain-containing protein n=1 Tax=Hugenholtzia roseola TaxID=1002 RepID=UPI0003FFDE7F|nr:7TM diverse intracellular signaling domain-containing protein [Hugenholtzia roseola]